MRPTLYEFAGGEPAFLALARARQRGMDELGRHFVDCFVAAADDAGLPAEPTFRAALRAYMRWAVGAFLAYPDSDADVPDGMNVPSWTWDSGQSSEHGA